jgi:uncharacterized protein with ATP-grasp and redox domains
MRQALDAARLSTNDEKTHSIILKQVMFFLLDFFQSDSLDNSLTPPELARHVYRIIKEITKCKDPYHEIKVKYNQIVWSWLLYWLFCAWLYESNSRTRFLVLVWPWS